MTPSVSLTLDSCPFCYLLTNSDNFHGAGDHTMTRPDKVRKVDIVNTVTNTAEIRDETRGISKLNRSNDFVKLCQSTVG